MLSGMGASRNTDVRGFSNVSNFQHLRCSGYLARHRRRGRLYGGGTHKVFGSTTYASTRGGNRADAIMKDSSKRGGSLRYSAVLTCLRRGVFFFVFDDRVDAMLLGRSIRFGERGKGGTPIYIALLFVHL